MYHLNSYLVKPVDGYELRDNKIVFQLSLNDEAEVGSKHTKAFKIGLLDNNFVVDYDTLNLDYSYKGHEFCPFIKFDSLMIHCNGELIFNDDFSGQVELVEP